MARDTEVGLVIGDGDGDGERERRRREWEEMVKRDGELIYGELSACLAPRNAGQSMTIDVRRGNNPTAIPAIAAL